MHLNPQQSGGWAEVQQRTTVPAGSTQHLDKEFSGAGLADGAW